MLQDNPVVEQRYDNFKFEFIKPFITGTELPPFKEDVFLKQKNNLKKAPMANCFSFPEMKT